MNHKNNVTDKKYKELYTCTKRDLQVKYTNTVKKNKKSNAKTKDSESKI